MTLGEFGNDEAEEEEENDSVSYVYIRHPQHPSNGDGYNQDAYNLVSEGGLVRRYFKSDQSDYENIHEFASHMFANMEPLLADGNWAPMLEELGVSPQGIAQYLDRNPEVREEVAELMQSTEE